MTITELREAFYAGPDCDRNRREILAALRDPTPITQAGLWELGFRPDYQHKPVWVLGDTQAGVDKGVCAICGPTVTALAKSMGRLRMLLLSVGVVE